MPNSYDNKGVIGFYAEAKGKELFGKNVYATVNHKEFFAVTASIFLSGEDSTHEPNTRADPEREDAGLLQVSGGPVRVRSGSDAPRCARLSGGSRDAGRLAAPAAPATPVASAAPAASPASMAAPAPKAN